MCSCGKLGRNSCNCMQISFSTARNSQGKLIVSVLLCFVLPPSCFNHRGQRFSCTESTRSEPWAPEFVSQTALCEPYDAEDLLWRGASGRVEVFVLLRNAWVCLYYLFGVLEDGRKPSHLF